MSFRGDYIPDFGDKKVEQQLPDDFRGTYLSAGIGISCFSSLTPAMPGFTLNMRTEISPFDSGNTYR
jgi:hypothetical protein